MGSIPLAVLSLLVSVQASAATLLLGPMLREVRPDRVVIGFQTDVAPGTAAIEYGETEAYGSSVPATITGVWTEVAVTGLPAKTLRHYRLVLDGTPVGRPGTFVTAPAAPEPFTFLLYGDTRSNPDAHALVVARMKEHPAAFLVNTGDLVENGSRDDLWQPFMASLNDLIGDMPFYAVVGNHDLDGDGPPDNFIRYVGPLASENANLTYRTQDWAGVRLIYLDRFYAGTVDVECFIKTGAFEFCLDKPQMAWLVTQLEAARNDATVKHVLVVVHEGPYSSEPDRNGSGEMRLLLNDFARSKVRAVLSGHDHYYEHGIAGNGMHYVISGGGGAPLYETIAKTGDGVPPHQVVMSTSVYHFLRVAVDGDRMEFTTYQADGTEMESFAVDPPPPCSQAQDCPGRQADWCEGQAECTQERRCAWICNPPPECAEAYDCDARTPVEDCPGAWSCVDAKCVWTCDAVPDPGPGDTGPSADVPATDPGPVADAAPITDAAPAIDTAPVADTVAPDTTVVTPPDAGPPAKKSGGCTAIPVAGAPAGLLPLLLLLPLAARRRRG